MKSEMDFQLHDIYVKNRYLLAFVGHSDTPNLSCF